jgi:hypothetical protein
LTIIAINANITKLFSLGRVSLLILPARKAAPQDGLSGSGSAVESPETTIAPES